MDVSRLTLADATELIRGGGMKPSELVSEFLDRIEKYDRLYRTFTLVMGRQARAIAGAKDSLSSNQTKRSPLHGVPIAIKDIYDVKGVPTTAGTTIYPLRAAQKDAIAVGMLRRAGAIILGKLNLHEIAMGVTSMNPHFGTVRNPWNAECIAGGSSGGSGSALAASFCLGSLGTDTGGSIRIPASLTGTVGFKPTYGLIDRTGVVPLSWSLDHVGPMAKTVKDSALLLEVLTGTKYSLDGPDPKKVKIAVPKRFFWDGIDGDVRRNMEQSIQTLEKNGYAIDDTVELPQSAQARNVLLFIILSEASTLYHRALSDVRKRSQFGADVLPRLDQGRTILATHYLNAQRLRRVYVERLLRGVMSDYDIVLIPTTQVPAPKIGVTELRMGGKQVDVTTALTRCTTIFNLTGFPAISIPNGFSKDGLPTGMQMASRPFNEKLILQVADHYETKTKWCEKTPTLQSPP